MPRTSPPAPELEAAAFRPLCPEARDQGDPYLLAPPPGAAARRYYVYVTGEDAATGAAFPVYASDDLLTWTPLGPSLAGQPRAAHWAPCVRHVPGLARPYVMLFSRAVGTGEAAHIGHVVRRADAEQPEGPFRESGHALTAGIDFAIDPDVYRRPDGRLMLAYATDFVADAPLGTGIVEVGVREDLTAVEGEPAVLARATYDWQVYDPARKLPWMTIPGVDWARDTVRWNTVEAPCGGLVSPAGRPVYLYSGGCFFDFYAVGAIERTPDGVMRSLTDAHGGFVLRPRPEAALYAPGHCCWFDGPEGASYLLFHARFGSPDAPRQFALAPLRWDERGRPVADPPAPTGQAK
jgi:hypothetical protein